MGAACAKGELKGVINYWKNDIALTDTTLGASADYFCSIATATGDSAVCTDAS